MSLSDFTTVTITATTQTPTRVGFGTPLVLGYFTAWPDRVRTYQNLTDMVADGITSTGVGAGTYWKAAAIFAQSPRVEQIKVGRRTAAFTQVVKVVPSFTEGVVNTITIAPLGGSSQTFTRLVPAASTLALEITALKTLIDASSPALAVTTASADTNTTLSITANTAGAMFVFSAHNKEMTLAETTAAPSGIDTDLDSCRAADDDWYDFTLDSTSKAESLVVAGWVETKTKVYFGSTADTENGTVGASSTLLKQLQALGYDRTSTWYDSAATPSFLDAGILGEEAPYDPGTAPGTYHAKTVAGVTVDNPSTTAEGEVVTRGGNVFTTVSGLRVTRPGQMASGQFIDITRGIDWLTARLKEAVFGVIAGNRRIAYTDGGVAMVKAAVHGVLKRAQGTVTSPGFLDPEHEITVTAPLVADIDVADRAARILPDVKFSAKISGAIHKAIISGTISV